eukprot:173576-Pyramimonas_sp.AAC.1
MAEVEVGGHTDYHRPSHATSSLDRLFVSVPGWELTQLSTAGQVHGFPEVMHQLELSDHAAVST